MKIKIDIQDYVKNKKHLCGYTVGVEGIPCPYTGLQYRDNDIPFKGNSTIKMILKNCQVTAFQIIRRLKMESKSK